MKKTVKTVRVEVRGGVIEITDCPDDVHVMVYDYDEENYDHDQLTRDENGEICHISAHIGRAI